MYFVSLESEVETVFTQNIKTVVWTHKLCHRSAVFDGIIVNAESMETNWKTDPPEAAI
jgi:hypothetical protein